MADNDIKWVRQDWGRNQKRHRLWRRGEETPYFINHSSSAVHWYMGYRYSLWGSGMSPSSGALFLSGFDRLADAKADAEQRAAADAK